MRAKRALGTAMQISQARTMPDIQNMTIGTAKRSTLAILFVDTVQYTNLVNRNRNKLEVVLAVMNLLIGEVSQIIKDYDAAFEKNTGDGIMAYFGTETLDATHMAAQAVGVDPFSWTPNH